MRNWKIRQQSRQAVRALCNALSCTHFFAKVLINRGYDTPEKAQLFLNNDGFLLNDPFLFKQMEAAVERIHRALKHGEKITVYGDYDVDGITATGLMVEALRSFGATVDYYIPSRFTEGYGVNEAAVRSIAEKGTGLIITVDTGITAVSEVQLAKSLGVDVIITDHHECQPIMPDTVIINPRDPNSGYPFAELAGVGVAYKLVCALDRRIGDGSMSERFLGFTAIGTISDIMPMRGENRYIVSRGLELLENTECVGLHEMIKRCLGDRVLDTSAVGFVIAPRINAAGRLGEATTGVDLLTTNNPNEANKIVESLCLENNRRQEIENSILEEAVSMLEEQPLLAQKNAIVLWSENWHNGVVGIVASRLKDRYGKPCILFSLNDDLAKGSGRSVRPFNLFDALGRVSHCVEKFGGHAFAAGVLVRRECLEQFRDSFCAEVDAFLSENAFDESVEVDCILHEADLHLEKVQALKMLAPYGRDNETPVFCMRDVTLIDAIPTANGNHLRMVLQSGHTRLTAFYFNMPHAAFPYRGKTNIDLIFEADINTYNGRQSVQLSVKDVCYHSKNTEAYLCDLKKNQAGKVSKKDVPHRNHTAVVYRYLHKQLSAGVCAFDLFQLTERLNLSVGVIYHSMLILRELGILSFAINDNVFSAVQIHGETRADFESSLILSELKKKAGE